jgi:hypothetical protein
MVRGGTPGSVGVALPQCMQNCAASGRLVWHDGQVRAAGMEIRLWDEDGI